jgi:DNA-binding CsgD family transcriptional regulator
MTGQPSAGQPENTAVEAYTGKDESMPQIDIEILTPFAARFLEGTTLTPAERAEVLRIAQGFACKDSAAAAGVSPETIRARRKRIYRKLDVPGSGELLASLLLLSLKMLAKGERIEPRPAAPAQPQPSASSATGR